MTHTKSTLIFPRLESGLVRQPVLVTGVMRSGTSILTQLIGTFRRIELFYEPWPFMMIPVFHEQGWIQQSAAEMALKKFCEETFLHSLMGRNLNSRPGDFSSYKNFLEQGEVEQRWKTTKSRQDAVQRLKKHSRRMVVKSSNLQPYYAFLYRSMPDLKIIHIARHPADVAQSTQKKGWYSHAGLNQPESMPVRSRGKSVRTPYFLEDRDMAAFRNYGLRERGLLCWISLMEKHIHLKRNLKLKPHQLLEISYEELLNKPSSVTAKLCNFLKLSEGPKTKSFLSKIRPRSASTKLQAAHLEPRHKTLLTKLMKQMGYETR